MDSPSTHLTNVTETRLTRRSCLGALALGLIPIQAHSHAAVAFASTESPDDPFEPRLHLRLRNSVSGDAHPFFHEGLWHLFFLGDRFEVHRATSDDLLHWTLLDPIHQDRERGAEISPYFVLGIVRDEATGRFRTWHGQRGAMVCHESEDLNHWIKADARYSVPTQARYSQQRDPYVLWNEDEAQWWCVMTCKVAGEPEGKNGAIGFASSPDLRDWMPRGDLFFPGQIGAPEVPQLIKLAGRWYLFASLLSPRRVGPASYWISESSTGPWRTPHPETLDGEDLAAMNYGFDGQRWIGWGWVPQHDFETHGKDTWGGHFGLPRELVPLDDGRLGVRLPTEVRNRVQGPKQCSLVDLELDPTLSWKWNEQQLVAQSPGQTTFPGTHRGVVVGLTVQHREGEFGLRWLDAHGKAVSEFAFDGKRVRFRGLIEKGDGSSWVELASIAIKRSAMVADQPSKAPTDSFLLVIERDIAEVFLNDRQSLAARLPIDLDLCRFELFVGPTADTERVDVSFAAFDLHTLRY